MPAPITLPRDATPGPDRHDLRFREFLRTRQLVWAAGCGCDSCRVAEDLFAAWVRGLARTPLTETDYCPLG